MRNRLVKREKDAHFLLAAALLVALTILSQKGENPDEQRRAVKDKAEILGYQVIQIYKDNIKNSDSEKVVGEGPNEDGMPEDMKADSSDEVSGRRGLASVHEKSSIPAKYDKGREGFIGMDPWGHPFQFRIVSVDDKLVKVLVWSGGSEGSREDMISSEVSVGESWTKD